VAAELVGLEVVGSFGAYLPYLQEGPEEPAKSSQL